MKKSLLADDLKMQFVDKKCGESKMLLEALNASKNSLKGILTDVFQNRCSKKFRNIHKNTPVFVSLFKNLHAWRPATLLKRDSGTGIFLWILRNF